MNRRYSREEILSLGVEYDSLHFKLHDERAYADEQDTLFSGILYSLYPDGSLESYEIYEDGWGTEKICYYESGRIASHAVYRFLSARRKEEKWYENGQRKALSYYSGGILIAKKCWNEEGILIEKMSWNDGKKICGLFFCGGKTMENKICSGKMTEEECLNMQLYLQSYVMQEQVMETADIHTIAGVDLAYWEKDTKEEAVCCIVIMDAKTHEILERVHQKGEVVFPYIPGYLAFRELPLVLETAKKLTRIPDVYMFDGNGILHPRRMGLATQASIFLKKPTLGVAKSYYKVEGAVLRMPEAAAGSYTDIIAENEVLGRVLRTKKSVKPVFVSVGNYMSLQGAAELVLGSVGKVSHIPIPTWEADQDTHKMRSYYRQMESESEK